jgi:hypothetical protein
MCVTNTRNYSIIGTLKWDLNVKIKNLIRISICLFKSIFFSYKIYHLKAKIP